MPALTGRSPVSNCRGIAKVNRTVREYVEQVERENVVAEPEQISDPSLSEAEDQLELRRTYGNSPPMKISTTDPEAALSSKRGASEFAYYDHYLIDNRSCIIAGVMATPARLSQEIIAARQMLQRARERFGLQPVSVTADKSYGTGEFLSWPSHRRITVPLAKIATIAFVLKRTLTFLVHQLISTFGVIIGCGIATTETASLFNLLSASTKALRASWLLIEIPGFPLQVASALLLGYSLALKSPVKAMLWVWIFPWLVLVVAALAIDASHPAPLSYFFGRGCLVVKHCFSQTAITLPALTSAAYALGAMLATLTQRKSTQ